MKVTNYLDTEPVVLLPGVVRREVITANDGAPHFCMRILDVEPGSATRSHSHEGEHEIFILSGRGVVVGEQEETPIEKDSVIFVAPDEQHCLVNTGTDPLRLISVSPLQL